MNDGGEVGDGILEFALCPAHVRPRAKKYCHLGSIAMIAV